MKITGISFSYSPESMNLRGLYLMDKIIDFHNLLQINLPICNANSPNGIVPIEVDELDAKIGDSDILVFAIPEYTGQYAAGFKNFIDWLVVKANYNASIGKGYSITDKPIYVITFTPADTGSGNRHFESTKELLEKLGAKVKKMYVKNNCWENLTPDNTSFVQSECREISQQNLLNEVTKWTEQYKTWNEKWNIKIK